MRIAILALCLLPLPALAALRGTTVAQTATSVTSISITYSGTAIQVGDLEILTSVCNAGGSPEPFTDPSGWTAGGSLTSAIPDVLINSSAELHVAVKIAAAGDTGTPSYTTSSSFACHWVQNLRVYSGRVNSSINAAFPNNVATVAGASGNTPYAYSLTGLTATAGDDIVAFVGGNISAGGPNYNWSIVISGYANALGFTGDGVGNGPLLSIDQVDSAGGATGTLASTISVGSTSTMIPAGFVMALPASGGTACTHAGISKLTGAPVVPTAGSTLVWLKSGQFGTVDCATTEYWQTALGNFGVN